MKNPVCTTFYGVLLVAVFGAAAAHPRYRSDLPRPVWPDVKRTYLDKQTAFLDDQGSQVDQDAPDQSEALQVWEKRGFGSMMPAYLLQLYRPSQPLINPSVLFSRTSQGRDKSGFNGQG